MTLTDALNTFTDHLPDIRKACVENYQEIIKQPHKTWDVDQEPATVENLMLHVDYLDVQRQTDPLQRTIRRIDGRQRSHGPGRITDTDIERAREYPITELWQELVGTPIKAGMAKCCFHEDDTASLSLRRYNRYRCFGCDDRGSTIDLVMKLEGVGFIDAVKRLSK